MDIDEPRRHDFTADVDRSKRGFVDRWRNAGDRAAADSEIGAIPRAAGPVDDPGVAEHQVVGRDLSRRPGDPDRGHRQRGETAAPASARRSPRVTRIEHHVPGVLQNREEVSVTSARAHAFFSRCSTTAASSFLPCASKRLVQPEERPAVVAIALEVVPVNGLRFRGPARFEKRRAEPVPDRRMPVGRLGVGQPVLEAHGPIEMRDGARRTASAVRRCRR